MTRRILFVIDRPCFPVRDGSSQRYVAWLEYLRLQKHQTYLLSFNGREHRWDRSSIETLRAYSTGHLLLNDYRPGAAWAIRTFLNLLSSATTGSRYHIGNVEQWYCRKNREQILSFLDRHSIDTVLVNKVSSAVMLGTEILKRFPGRKIIDIHDIHANHFLAVKKVLDRFEAYRFLCRPSRKFFFEKLVSRFFDHQAAVDEEVGIYRLFDTILPTSLQEYEWLRSRFPEEIRISYLPPMILPRNPENPGEEVAERYDAGIIASSGLLNVEGILYFGSHILPEILRRKPEFRLLIAGGICADAQEVLGRRPEITFIPRFENLNEFYQSIKTVLVPILSGSGISVKTLEGMAYGKPVVSMTAGVRGLEVNPAKDVIVEDDPMRFVGALLNVLEDAPYRERISREALSTIEEKYSMERHHAVLNSVLMG